MKFIVKFALLAFVFAHEKESKFLFSLTFSLRSRNNTVDGELGTFCYGVPYKNSELHSSLGYLPWPSSVLVLPKWQNIIRTSKPALLWHTFA